MHHSQAISGDISQTETQSGCGVVQAETIGPDATPARVLPVKVVLVTDAILLTVRRLQITIANLICIKNASLTASARLQKCPR
jgi:hypothetical protein